MKIGLVRRGYSATGGAEAYLLRLPVRWPPATRSCSFPIGRGQTRYFPAGH
jgi:hypothetical protein